MSGLCKVSSDAKPSRWQRAKKWVRSWLLLDSARAQHSNRTEVSRFMIEIGKTVVVISAIIALLLPSVYAIGGFIIGLVIIGCGYFVRE